MQNWVRISPKSSNAAFLDVSLNYSQICEHRVQHRPDRMSRMPVAVASTIDSTNIWEKQVLKPDGGLDWYSLFSIYT